MLPGASLDESIIDDDEDWMLSLEGPPSPCDVMFINDNILIDGRSSLSQKSKKLKVSLNRLKYEFVNKTFACNLCESWNIYINQFVN